jgi:hypothetical protein
MFHLLFQVPQNVNANLGIMVSNGTLTLTHVRSRSNFCIKENYRNTTSVTLTQVQIHFLQDKRANYGSKTLTQVKIYFLLSNKEIQFLRP